MIDTKAKLEAVKRDKKMTEIWTGTQEEWQRDWKRRRQKGRKAVKVQKDGRRGLNKEGET
jgi:hypothetical protein